ncbi:MAG: hypothetical protein FWG20_06180 [Candidatus Cloacimonetes bacterium]|nr:hypothetical protein [Candidatus Cloacimonadota bacterium]
MISEYWHTFLGQYHKRRGIRLLSKACFQKAQSHFEKSILYIEDIESLYFYAVCLISLNKHEQAINYLSQIYEKTPNENIVAATLLECYIVTRKWELATEMIEHPNFVKSENLTLQTLITVAQDPEKREIYASSKEHFFTAMNDLKNKKIDDALRNIEKAIEYEPENPSYYYTASLIVYEGRRPKADVTFYLEKAIKYAPQNEQYKKLLHHIQTRYK